MNKKCYLNVESFLVTKILFSVFTFISNTLLVTLHLLLWATGDSSASTNLPPKTIQLQLALQWPKSGSCTLSSNKVFSCFSTSKLKKNSSANRKYFNFRFCSSLFL